MSPLIFVTPKRHILAWFRVFWVITSQNRSKGLTCGLFPEKRCADWSSGLQTKNFKSRSKGAWCTSRDLIFKFWYPLHISGMGAARDFKFGERIHRLAYKPQNAKVGQKGRGLRRVTYFCNFGTPPLYLWTWHLTPFRAPKRRFLAKLSTENRLQWALQTVKYP